jgi:hypothetical protein
MLTNDLWLAFTGHWGKEVGPTGPSQKKQWDDPVGWSNGQPWDEMSAHNLNKFTCSASYPRDVHVYDAETNEHVGLAKDGAIEEKIPHSEFIDNDWAEQRTILLHDPKPLAWSKYRCETSGVLAKATLDRDELDSSAPFTMTLNVPNYASNTINSVIFTNINLPVEAKAVISASSETDYSLLVDEDGDGTNDSSIAPTTHTIEAADFSPPAGITDLSVVSTAPGAATLRWTASGDDGHAGKAAAYDIRYFRAPVTELNWALATQIIDPPRPSPAGATELITITGLPPGAHSLALQVIDDAFQPSPLSNRVSVEIPARIFLPLAHD